jgi:hypothetical protein
MQISAATTTTTTSRATEQTPSAPTVEPTLHEADPVDVRRVATLLVMLENKPQVRPEVLARGRALAADPTYPQPDIINKLAGMVIGELR